MDRIAEGFALAEAPVVSAEGVLFVSDVLHGGVRCFDSAGRELAPLLERRRGIGGMAVRSDDNIIVSGRDLSTVRPDGAMTVVAELLDGGTGFNDLAIASDGTVVAGMLTCHPMSGGPLTAGVLVLVDPLGATTSAPLPFAWPNGIGFSRASDRVFVADFDSGVLFESRWTGRSADLSFEPWWRSPTGDADGLTVTMDGHVFVAGGSGGSVLVVSPDGELVEQIDVPYYFVSSCCFWGNEATLAITTGTGVFVQQM